MILSHNAASTMQHWVTIMLRAFCLVVRSLTNGLVVICLAFTSCSPGSGLPPLPDTQAGPYRLSAGDEVRVITFGQEQLSQKFTVNDQGSIDMPLIGGIPANGATTAELSHRIEQKLIATKVLLEPSVAVEISIYRPMFILGEVSKPGQFPYQPGMTVLTAIAVAGGFTYRAETQYASMLRNSDGHAIEGRVSRDTEVRPGDVITVLERYF
jgi:polysaccharide biosynthesis/export protein